MTRKRHSFYQTVMRRLVRRYIHQSKKTMRLDGVNEDDLLEIKQDISSLRYELREDRKREVARTIGHLEGLKREIVTELRTQFYDHGMSRGKTAEHAIGAPTHHPSPSAPPEEGTSKPESACGQSAVSEAHVLQSHDLLTRARSIAYGQETQCIYDEIKQLALINTAYERSKQAMPNSRSLPVNTYTQLKSDIISGVKEELTDMIQQLRHELVIPSAIPRTCEAEDTPGASKSSSRAIVSKADRERRPVGTSTTSLISRYYSTRSSRPAPITVEDSHNQLDRRNNRGIIRNMSSHSLGWTEGSYASSPMDSNVTRPLRSIYRSTHSPLSEEADNCSIIPAPDENTKYTQ